MLAAPETLPLFLRKLQRKALKQYQRREPICKGSGDIICMLDESSSAESQAPWCKAVALALLDIAMRDQRRFAVIHLPGLEMFRLISSCRGSTTVRMFCAVPRPS